jgi:hypothetical protein
MATCQISSVASRPSTNSVCLNIHNSSTDMRCRFKLNTFVDQLRMESPPPPPWHQATVVVGLQDLLALIPIVGAKSLSPFLLPRANSQHIKWQEETRVIFGVGCLTQFSLLTLSLMDTHVNTPPRKKNRALPTLSPLAPPWLHLSLSLPSRLTFLIN